MFSNTRKYYLENVEPSYFDFIEHRKSNEFGQDQLLRKGIIAATTLFHLREHIPTNIRPSKTELKRQFPYYGLVGDITNVSKHSEISNDNPKISRATQLREVMRLIYFSDTEGEYVAPQLDVIVQLDDGSELLLVSILDDVKSMWNEILDKLGIIEKYIRPTLNINEVISRQQAEIRRTNISIIRGEDLKLEYRVQKYNNGIIEPMDITNWEVKMNIYSLPEFVPIHLTISNPKMEKVIEFDFNVPLTNDQASKYIELPKNERNCFINEVIKSNSSIRNDLNEQMLKLIQEK